MGSARATVPVIDFAGFAAGGAPRSRIAREIGEACRAHGFFYVVGHGVDATLTRRLETLSRAFFAQDLRTKLRIAMIHGGRAWRGYFPVGAELTSGVPDRKEGLYLGTELSADHPLVRAGTPMHVANL